MKNSQLDLNELKDDPTLIENTLKIGDIIKSCV